MRVTRLAAAAVLGLLALGPAAPAGAQMVAPGVREPAAGNPAPRRVVRRAPTRIVVSPNQRLFRQCEDWLAVEHRPSGDVITPQQRCWWAAR